MASTTTIPNAPLETRPGPKTTEFWYTLASNVLGIFQMAVGPVNVEDNVVVIALAIINALYAVGRGLAKQNIPAPEAPVE